MEMRLKCSIELHGFDLKEDLNDAEAEVRVLARCRLLSQRKRLIRVHHCCSRARLRFGNGVDDCARSMLALEVLFWDLGNHTKGQTQTGQNNDFLHHHQRSCVLTFTLDPGRARPCAYRPSSTAPPGPSISSPSHRTGGSKMFSIHG